jgi:hypothetical protein
MSLSISEGLICNRINLYEFNASFLTDCSSNTKRISKIFKIFRACVFPPMHSINEASIFASSINVSSSSSSIESVKLEWNNLLIIYLI